MKRETLRRFIRCVIAEAAVSAGAAAERGLALHVVRRNNELRGVILYDATKTVQRVRRAFEEGRSFSERQVRVVAAVYCTYSKRNCGDDVRSIVVAAAHNGLGPLVYDVLLSQGLWITPDRDSVSAEAEAVWRYYYERRSDVEYRAIDAVDCKKHPSSKPWLNHAYRIDHPQDVSALAARDEQVIDTIKQLASVNDIELSDAKIEAALSAAGWDYDGN